MSKPKWEDAPEWAKFLAQDEDGMWCWFESRPVIQKGDDGWSGGKRWMVADPVPTVWKATLERRP